MTSNILSNFCPLSINLNPVEGDLEYLKEGLLRDSISHLPNFHGHFVKYLPQRPMLAVAKEKFLRMSPHVVRPLSQTGLMAREIKENSQNTEFNPDPFILSAAEKRCLDFNMAPTIPHYKFLLNEYQREVLGQLLTETQDTELLENLKGLAAKYLEGGYSLDSLSREEREALDLVNFKTIQDYLKNLKEILNDPASQLSKRAQLETRYDYKQALVAEILSKILAYNDHLHGKQMDLPIEINGRLKWVSYQIERHYLGDKLPFYTFKPLEPLHPLNPDYASSAEVDNFARAWIAIRGTEPLLKEDKDGVHESMAADFKDSQGVSSLPVWHRGSEILEIIHKISKNKLIHLAGHSLGGTLAQSLSVIFNHLIDQTYAFNSPGVDTRIHAIYEELPDAKKNQITVFHCEGDLISSASPKRIGQNLEIKMVGENREKFDPFIKHSDLLLNCQHHQKEVDLPKDEKNLMRRFSDWNRRNILARTLDLSVNSESFTWYKNRHHLDKFAKAYLKYIQNKSKP